MSLALFEGESSGMLNCPLATVNVLAIVEAAAVDHIHTCFLAEFVVCRSIIA